MSHILKYKNPKFTIKVQDSPPVGLDVLVARLYKHAGIENPVTVLMEENRKLKERNKVLEESCWRR